MRFAILGNSHALALYRAVRAHPELFRDVQFQWHVIRSQSVRAHGLKNRGGEVVCGAGDDGGVFSFTPANHDVVLICGFEMTVKKPTVSGAAYSRAVLEAARVDRIKDTIGFRLASMIRSVSEVPIILMHAPLPSQLKTEEAPFEDVEYAAQIGELNVELESVGMTLARQPSKTIVNGWHTASLYSQPSAHESESASHMNALFGVEMLRHVLACAGSSRSTCVRCEP